MERIGTKTRDIRFFSEKNKEIVCVHSRQARDYAKRLETDDWVERYEVNPQLDSSRFPNVLPVGIRSEYFQTAWSSDFLLCFADGRQGVRELLKEREFQKRAAVERLELSRRYWKLFDVEWKVVVVIDD